MLQLEALFERVKCIRSSFSGKLCFFGCIRSHTEHTNDLASSLHVVGIRCRTTNTLLNVQSQYLTPPEKLPHSPSPQSSNWKDRPLSPSPSVPYSSAWLPALVRCLWQAKTPLQLRAAACFTLLMLREHFPFTRAVVLEGTETNTDLQCLRCFRSQAMTAGKVRHK